MIPIAPAAASRGSVPGLLAQPTHGSHSTTAITAITAITAGLYTHVAPAVARDAAEAIADSVTAQMPAACWRDVGEKQSSAQTDARTERVE
jgi:hypothetical protein